MVGAAATAHKEAGLGLAPASGPGRLAVNGRQDAAKGLPDARTCTRPATSQPRIIVRC